MQHLDSSNLALYLSIICGSAIGGAIVGAIFSGIGHYIKIRAENLKIKKVVLFNLLRIWHSIYILTAIDFNLFSSMYLDKLSTHFNEKVPDEYKPQFQKAIKAQGKQLVSHFFFAGSDTIVHSFRESTTLLSSVDPIHAFEISNNDKIHSIFDSLEMQINQMNEEMILNAESVEDVERSSRFTDSYIDKLAVTVAEEIERDIYKLACKSSVFLLVRVFFKLRERKGKHSTTQQMATFDEYMDEVVIPAIEKAGINK